MYGNFDITCDDLFSDDINLLNNQIPTNINDNNNNNNEENLKSNSKKINNHFVSNQNQIHNTHNKNKDNFKPMFIITDSMLSTILRMNFKQISEYISNKKSLFQQIQLHSSISNKEYDTKLQSVLILTYKIHFIQLIQSLWTTYRKSGVDNLQIIPEIQNIDRKIWPKEFLHLANESQTLLFPTTIPDKYSQSSIQKSPKTYQFYLSFIDSCLFTLQKKCEGFHTILINEIQHLPDYHDQLKQQINLTIQHDLLPIQIEIDCHMELVHYDYKDEIYRRQYSSQISIEEPITLIEQLYQLKYEQEKLKSQINLFKYMQTIHSLEYFLENLPLMNCIGNPNLYQELYQEYKIFIEKLKSNVMNHYIESLEIRQKDYQTQFNQLTDTFWHINKTIPNQHQFTTITKNAIEQRFSNITDRFTCIDTYKRRLLQIQSSTD